jgi:hypothetical protein
LAIEKKLSAAANELEAEEMKPAAVEKKRLSSQIGEESQVSRTLKKQLSESL